MYDSANNDWKTEVVLVTPEMARDFLQMVRNRRLSEAHVRWFCGIIMRGEYRLTPHGVSINPEGYVNGGQHRLHAIVRTGRTLPMTINWGVTDEIAYLQDVGKPWSMADQFRLDPHITGVLSVFQRMAHGTGHRAGRQTESQLRPYRNVFLPTIEDTTSAKRRGASSSPSRAAAVLCMMDRNRAYAKEGYANLCQKGHRDRLTKCQHAYSEWLESQKGFSGDQLTPAIFCRGLLAFDAAYAERTTRTFGKDLDDSLVSTPNRPSVRMREAQDRILRQLGETECQS